VSALVRELYVHASNSDDHAAQVDAEFAAAASSLTSAPVADAMARLSNRFHGRSADIGARMGSLGTALSTAANAVIATDSALTGDGNFHFRLRALVSCW
jgi:hypothetical protein